MIKSTEFDLSQIESIISLTMKSVRTHDEFRSFIDRIPQCNTDITIFESYRRVMGGGRSYKPDKYRNFQYFQDLYKHNKVLL